MGWEMRLTSSGKQYFVDHNNRTTQFTDPRLTASSTALTTSAGGNAQCGGYRPSGNSTPPRRCVLLLLRCTYECNAAMRRLRISINRRSKWWKTLREYLSHLTSIFFVSCRVEMAVGFSSGIWSILIVSRCKAVSQHVDLTLLIIVVVFVIIVAAGTRIRAQAIGTMKEEFDRVNWWKQVHSTVARCRRVKLLHRLTFRVYRQCPRRTTPHRRPALNIHWGIKVTK